MVAIFSLLMLLVSNVYLASGLLLPTSSTFCIGRKRLTAKTNIYCKTGKEYDVVVRADGDSRIVKLSSQDTILNGLENAGFEAPYSCRTGLCTECAALVTANIDSVELDAAVLDPETTGKGFILTCSARVKGEGVELTLGQHTNMYDSQYGNFRKDHEDMQKNSQSKGLLGGLNSALNLNTEA